jgi:hypothetical protein
VVLEHTFITTSDAPRVIEDASLFLQDLGFVVEVMSEATLKARRGCEKPSKAKKVSELPQVVRIDFDRGRVSLAASIQELRKVGDLHRMLLQVIARSLESLLARGMTPDEARVQWDAVDQQIEEDAAAVRRRSRILLFVLLLCILIPVALVAWVIAQS